MKMKEFTVLALILANLFALSWSQKKFQYMTGRNVCAKEKSDYHSYPVEKSYCIPKLQTFIYKCNGQNGHRTQGICTGYRTIYTMLKKKVYQKNKRSKIEFMCCPGWSRSTGKSGCTKPVCNFGCKNNGVCVKPNSCRCLPGWEGPNCEIDVNECKKNNGKCHQKCINTKGSFKCACEDGFQLNENGKMCEVCLTCNPEWREMNLRIQALEQITLKVTEQLNDLLQTVDALKIQKTKSEAKNRKHRVSSQLGVLPETDSLIIGTQDTQQSQNQQSNQNIPAEFGVDMQSTIQVFSTVVDKVAILEARLEQCGCSQESFFNNIIARHPKESIPKEQTKKDQSKKREKKPEEKAKQ